MKDKNFHLNKWKENLIWNQLNRHIKETFHGRYSAEITIICEKMRILD